MKRLIYILMIAAVLLLPVMAVAAEEVTRTINNPQVNGNYGACFDFADSLGKITYKSARLAVWDPQDNPSFQTLSDWGASLNNGISDPLDGTGYMSGTICVPQVLSDHCNKPGPMKIFFQLRDVTKRYHGRPVLSGLSFGIDEGEIFGSFPVQHTFSLLDAMDGGTLVEQLELAFETAEME